MSLGVCGQRTLYLLGLPEDAYCVGVVGYSELVGCYGPSSGEALEAKHVVAVRDLMCHIALSTVLLLHRTLLQ